MAPLTDAAHPRDPADRDGPRDPAGSAPDGAAGPEDATGAWQDLVATARRTVADGLVVGTSGNVSVRLGATVLVTPSGVPYDALGPGELCAVGLDGRRTAGALEPTSELPLHLAVYRATAAGAVVHTHAPHATAVSTLLEELPPVHYMTAALGGPVRVAPYATYGSPELAAHALAALEGRTACLLANHGTLAYGDTLAQAYERTAQLEWMCRVWLLASSVPGRQPALIDAPELSRVARKLTSYGQPPRRDGPAPA